MNAKTQEAPKAKSREPVTVHLDYPIEFGGETISEVTLRRATGKDVKALGAELGVGDFLKLAGKLGGLLPGAIDLLDASDAMKLSEVAGGFFGVSQESGGPG